MELVHIDDLSLSVGEALTPRLGPRWWPWADYHVWREEKLRKLVSDFLPARLKVRTIPGWPPSALISLARRTTADLVVMGTHGYAGLDRALFGSLSEAVIRRARVPVLAIHRRPSPFRPGDDAERLATSFWARPSSACSVIAALPCSRCRPSKRGRD